MKYLTSIILVVFAVCSLTSCRTKRVYVEEPKTVIGINELPREVLGDWVKCSACDGKGTCTDCNGTGKINGATCKKCEGTGKCTTCEGQGGWRTEPQPK